MSLVINHESQDKLKKMVIARKLSLNYDYCPNEDEAENDLKHVFECYLDKKKVTKKEILEACSLHSGRRSDEIENELAGCLATILGM
jgi:hypothetical protein